MPPESSDVSWLSLFTLLAILMYAPMNHMHSEPPMAPIISRRRRPRWSISTSSHTKVSDVLTTPKMPVVSRAVLVPLMPIDRNTVGL